MAGKHAQRWRRATLQAYDSAMKHDAATAYQEMTQAERAEHDKLVRRLDEMMTQRSRPLDRRQTVQAIGFPERRCADRRRG